MRGLFQHLVRVILAIGLVSLVLFSIFFVMYIERIYAEDDMYSTLIKGLSWITGLSICIGVLFCIMDHYYRKTGNRLRNAEMYYKQLQAKMETEMAYSEIFAKINELTEVFSNTHNLEAVLNEAARTLKQVLDVNILTLQLYSDEEDRFFMRIELGETDIDLGDDLKMDVIEEGKSHLINELDSVEKYSEIKEQGFRSIIITPLTKVRKGSGQKSIGLIAVLTRERRDFSNQELSLMAAFSRYASLIIQNAQLYVKTQELAIRDGLTNLFNHRHFRTKLQEVLQTSDKEETEFSLIITDIDNFKQYNDTHGHPKGDVILREISRVLLDNTRGADLVARYGGEEFVIILPSTSKMGAKQLCSIIREKLKEHPFPHGDTQPQGRVTMTFGVASYPKEAKDAEELIELADVRMYKGKYKGKDTIVTE